MDQNKPSNPVCKREATALNHRFKLWINVSAITAMILLVSCAGQPPKETISQAELAIQETSQTRAPQFAPLELRKARDHLYEAKQAMLRKDYAPARRLAEKAIVEAKLAEAKSEAENTQTTLAELRESLDALREEAESK